MESKMRYPLSRLPPFSGSTRLDFIRSVSAEKTGEQRHEGDADEGNTAAGHKLCHPQLVGMSTLDSRRRRSPVIITLSPVLSGL